MAEVLDEATLSVALELDGHQPSLAVIGKADRSNMRNVAVVLNLLADEHERCVSLDFGGIESMDTGALRCLAGSANAFKNRQKRLHLKEASGAVRSLLDKHSLSELFCEEQECAHRCSPSTCRIAARTWEFDVFTLPCEMAYCREVRTRVDRVAEAVGLNKHEREDIMLAVGEAAANAVRHGRTDEDENSIGIICVATQDRLCVSISDNGPGFCLDDIPGLEAVVLSDRGRGIHCINAVMDEVDFDFESGTTVRMVKLAG